MHGLQAPRGAGAVDPARLAQVAARRPARRSPYPVLVLVAAVCVVLDQLSKRWAVSALEDGPVELIEGVLRLRLTLNPGGAFGIFRERPGLFLVATSVVIVLVLFWARDLDDRRLLIPLGLIVGGGLGNLIDRVFRDLEGRVVDFIDLHVWPVFNVADMCVVSGVLAILVLTFRSERGHP